MDSHSPRNKKRVVILGASFDTGNLGVNALAWSSMKALRVKWPDARITLVGSGRLPGVVKVRLDDHWEEFTTWPARYCLNLLAEDHIIRLFLGIFLCRLLPFLKLRLAGNQSTLGELLRCDLICDITGGDSFSDLYGLNRLTRGYLLKRVCQMTGNPFILLPQTYGPFKAPLAKFLARRVLRRATTIYSRDQEGLAVVQGLIGPTVNLKLCPDVAFAMAAIRPDTPLTRYLEQLKAENRQLIGLNISGLLYNGGYTGRNDFGLRVDYRRLVQDIVKSFTARENTVVLLVPHVVPSGWEAENDLSACRKLRQSLPDDIRGKVIIIEPEEGRPFFDQCQIKYLIGQCSFFMGSRMHAVIAALSQSVPSVGLAYSRKFHGVFATAGVADCVLDLREWDNEEIFQGIEEIFARRTALHLGLKNIMPGLQHKVLNLFVGSSGPATAAGPDKEPERRNQRAKVLR
jgi:colanic acid/amylovoran biosynthesis protein